MKITDHLEQGVKDAVRKLYDADIDSVTLTPTRREFTGDYTVVTFPLTRIARKKPDQIAEELGAELVASMEQVRAYNVIKGFLNLEINDSFWLDFIRDHADNEEYGRGARKDERVMVEFSSPNTNKPLHLGHIRNILLGWSISKIYDAAGYEVVRVQIINDRGIAICKSMLAWQQFGNGETPESSGTKGDHLAGKYYVLFEKHFQEEYKAWQQTEDAQAIFQEKAKDEQDEKSFWKSYKNTYFNQYSQLGGAAKTMLQEWEAGNPEVRALWAKMNSWVYEGFAETYRQMGVEFDKLYYESDTYLLGRDTVERGIESGLFYQKEDNSVWVDLTDAKLDHKILLRSDGTSVYMTQDIGTAQIRYDDYQPNRMIYVVADEQNYHFQVLFEVMKRLEVGFADGLHHLSYGMIDLTTGKMKSREGTVVDADDLMAEVIEEARKVALESGIIAEMDRAEQDEIVRKIGLAALKFFLIKVQPKKRMTFNPAESVDLQGHTGPNVQYAYVRTHGVGQRAEREGVDFSKAADYAELQPAERAIVQRLYAFPEVVQTAAQEYDPSAIANYTYDLAKDFHKLWHDTKFFGAESEAATAFRLLTARLTGRVLRSGLDLLGIEVPERM